MHRFCGALRQAPPHQIPAIHSFWLPTGSGLRLRSRHRAPGTTGFLLLYGQPQSKDCSWLPTLRCTGFCAAPGWHSTPLRPSRQRSLFADLPNTPWPKLDRHCFRSSFQGKDFEPATVVLATLILAVLGLTHLSCAIGVIWSQHTQDHRPHGEACQLKTR